MHRRQRTGSGQDGAPAGAGERASGGGGASGGRDGTHGQGRGGVALSGCHEGGWQQWFGGRLRADVQGAAVFIACGLFRLAAVFASTCLRAAAQAGVGTDAAAMGHADGL